MQTYRTHLFRPGRALLALLLLPAGLALAEPPARQGDRPFFRGAMEQQANRGDRIPAAPDRRGPPREGYAGRPPAGGYAGPAPGAGGPSHFDGNRGRGDGNRGQGDGHRGPGDGNRGDGNRGHGPRWDNDRGHNDGHYRGPPSGSRFYGRPGYGYGGYRYGPRFGAIIPVLPGFASTYWYGGSNFYFSSGIWYRPYQSSYLVVAPPVGIVIPLLPPYYETRIIGSNTYYYANDTYYRAVPDGYAVTESPEEASPANTTVASTQDKVFYYPRNGQSQTKQNEDRFQCHEWAVLQTGYDPTLPSNGGTNANPGARADYARALDACMDGRGYTMR